VFLVRTVAGAASPVRPAREPAQGTAKITRWRRALRETLEGEGRTRRASINTDPRRGTG
jgi:hypothetical protein